MKPIAKADMAKRPFKKRKKFPQVGDMMRAYTKKELKEHTCSPFVITKVIKDTKGYIAEIQAKAVDVPEDVCKISNDFKLSPANFKFEKWSKG